MTTKPTAMPPGFGQLRRAARLADQLYEQVVAQIIDGTLPEGERLPAETRLCEIYGVSRPVVREAIFRLQADGLVHTRHGAGTYVAKRPRDEFLRLAPIGGMADLMRCYELRLALEGEAAALAALRQQPETMAGIETTLAALDEAVAKHEIGVEADHAFHVAVARATQNELFIQSLDALSAHIFAGMHVARSLSLAAPDPARLALVQAEHRAIAAALRARDTDGARAAMRTHIDNARKRILASA